MNFSGFKKTICWSFFNESYNSCAENFKQINLDETTSISKESQEFIKQYGWFSGFNGFFPNVEFGDEATMFKSSTSRAKRHGYSNVAIWYDREIGIFNNEKDTVYVIDEQGGRKYFARSLSVVVCYGILARGVVDKYIQHIEKDRHEFQKILPIWLEATDFFKSWDPQLWDDWGTLISSQFESISELISFPQ